MVRVALMRVRRGNYCAAPYLNSFGIVPVSLTGAVRFVLLIGELVCVIPLFVISLC